eukprot:191399-Rhodomonas_salina.1
MGIVMSLIQLRSLVVTHNTTQAAYGHGREDHDGDGDGGWGGGIDDGKHGMVTRTMPTTMMVSVRPEPAKLVATYLTACGPCHVALSPQ